MTLRELLTYVNAIQVLGDLNRVVVGNLRFDSRLVQDGDVFVAVRGVQVDGHNYIKNAVAQGATAVVCEVLPDNPAPEIVWVAVGNSAEALGQMAHMFFGKPSEALSLVGVTGTNGKTTTVTLLYQLFTKLGYRAGLIGTVENRIGEQVMPSTHTTPDSVRLHELLGEMVNAGCSFVFMEVSSHAVHQHRIAGVKFSGAVFTNLTHDHLDYHGTFSNYRDAKKKFFDDLPPSSFALINADDKNGLVMLQNTKARKLTYALRTMADFKSKILENALTGLHLQINGDAVHTRLIGEFNAYNLTAAFGVAMELQQEKWETLTALSDLKGAEGRFDYLVNPAYPQQLGIVDYAHTPDALEKVLETIRKFKSHNAKVITVVGCGGDRDKAKRPVMAKTAARNSEQLILTSDNPRSEPPEVILNDMEAGLDPADQQKTLTIENREQAIKTACRMASPFDIILIAGKGHEKYQEINGVKHAFDDKAMLQKYMSATHGPPIQEHNSGGTIII